MKQLLQSLTFGLDLALPVAKHQKRGSVSRKRRRRRADIIGEPKVRVTHQLATTSLVGVKLAK